MRHTLESIATWMLTIAMLVPIENIYAQENVSDWEERGGETSDASLEAGYSEFNEEDLARFAQFSLDELLQVKLSVASRSQQNANHAPGSVTVFTREELLLMGITDLHELLNFVPGLHSTPGIWQGKYGRYNVRGINHQSGVLFLLDGERFNSLYSGGTSFANLIPFENIARIEILRGPGSSMWGTNALLGVVNIVTVRDHNTAVFGLGDTRRLLFGVNQVVQVSNKLTMNLYAAYDDDEGYEFDNVLDRAGNRISTQDGVRQLNAAMSLRYGEFEARVRHATRSDHRGFGPWGVQDRWNDMNSSVTTAHLSYKRQLVEEKIDANGTLALRRDLIDGGGRQSNVNLEAGLPEPRRAMYDIEMVEVRPAVNAAMRLIDGNELNLGAEFSYLFVPRTIAYSNVDYQTGEHLGDIMELEGEASTIDPDAVRTNLGLYVENHHQFSNWLALTGGLRFDVANDYANALSPRIAAVFTAPFGAWAKAMYGRAFRASNLRESYVDVPGTIVGNQNLLPEVIDTYELSVGGSLKTPSGRSWISATATGFRTQTDDLITLQRDETDTLVFTNLGDERSYGLEFEVQAEPVQDFRMRATYTHLFRYRRDGERMDTIEQPMDSASAIINYRLRDIAINANGIFRSSPGALANQDAYFIMGAAVHYFWTPYLRTTLAVENIADEVYYGVSERPDLPEGVPHRGRTILLGLRYGD